MDNKNETVARLLEEFVTGAAKLESGGAVEWPQRDMVEQLEKLDLTGVNLNVDLVARTFLSCAIHSGKNARIGAVDRHLRSKLPPEVLDTIDFQIATQIINSSEYVRWVIVLLGGWLNLNDGNCHCFNHAIRHMPEKGAVIEIGSFLGVSIAVISYFLILYQRSNPLYNIDPWAFEETEKPIGGFYDASSKKYRDYCVETYKSNIRAFCDKRMPFTVEAFSDDFFRDWSRGATVKNVFGNKAKIGGPISFAYIDGAHTYEAAKADFENVDRHLLTGGFVLFDDSNPNLKFGCVRSAQEAAQNPKYRRVFSHVNGLNVFLQKVRD